MIDFRHDVARTEDPVRHIIMRNDQTSLCGVISRSQKLSYVGVWDGGERPTCAACRRQWKLLRAKERRKETKMNLPPDPEGMNDDRAAWACVALSAFQLQTGTLDEDDGTILGDLLCDLRHYCDRHDINFDAVFERSTKCYHEETAR